ncbi:MAG: N-acetylglucosamine-6-sulfatase [Thermoleophilaceae bacterium]|nr:N-acetylglucosamine-6-sulfatase [Thermoleophilaceae bacterium]
MLAGPAAAQPNVVVLMTDDQTAESLRYMPNVKRLLVDEGTLFRDSVATFPLCCPSRSTHLTGQYSHNHQVLHNAGPFGGFSRLDHANTLPVWLQTAGYRTMHVGRYLNGYEYSDGVPPGWSDWHAAPHSHAFNYTRWQVNENGSLVSYPDAAHPDEYETDFFGRRAGELIEQAAPGDRPFYLQLWFVAPHRGSPRDPDDPTAVGSPSPAPRHRDLFAGTPFPRKPSFDEAQIGDKPQVVADRPRLDAGAVAGIEENWRQELESLQAVDEAVAHIVDTLGRTGELANTLIVFTSDNGFMHGEHRVKAEKVLLYEESVRVPLVMRGPGVPRGWRDPRPVGNIDVAPTIVDAADATARRVPDGRSLLPLLADRTAWWGRDILLENGNGANNVPPYRAIRTNRFVWAEHLTTGEFELYDLENDPYELRSLDSDPTYDPIQRDLAQRLRTLKRCAGRGCQKAPALRLAVRSAGRTLQDGDCVRADLDLRVTGRDRRRMTGAVAFVAGHRVARVSSAAVERRIRRPRVRGGRRYLVRVRADLRDGRRVTLDRPLRGCA